MVSRHHRVEQYELLPRTSHDSTDNLIADHDGSSPARPKFFAWPSVRLPLQPARSICSRIHRRRRSRGLLFPALCWSFVALASFTTLLIIATYILRPSYARPPDRYRELEQRCRESKEPGRGNVNNEKIFIATSLYDPGGRLVDGDWGSAVLELVDLLGPHNVHLSVYENDADQPAKAALQGMEQKVNCNTTIMSEHFSLDDLPRIRTLSGENRTKRIAFLAEVRNRALRSLQNTPELQFDKLLFMNDVIFNPVDAVNLLFSTNSHSSGQSQYQAACAVDFINAFKFYDRFATRDFEGYTTGIPFFPWFTGAGDAISRQDVLQQKDAVRVRSCWGGMTAFEAKWFQSRPPVNLESLETRDLNDSNSSGFDISPLRFRYEGDLFWDASECCLIHADLTYLHQGNNIATDSGIFMNPFIRVAYDSYTLGWLPYTRRVERLYSPVHTILNRLVGMPEPNPRRLESPGDEVVERVWKYSEAESVGSYEDVKRVVEPGRFCGTRKLMVLNENPQKGQKNWENLPIPSGP